MASKIDERDGQVQRESLGDHTHAYIAWHTSLRITVSNILTLFGEKQYIF